MRAQARSKLVNKQKTRKRKQDQLQQSSQSKAATKQEPYRTRSQPTLEDCLAIRDDLLTLHGFPQEYATYRNQRLNQNANTGDQKDSVKSKPLDDDVEKESVLDGLVKTVLSLNTTEVNSLKAFASL